MPVQLLGVRKDGFERREKKKKIKKAPFTWGSPGAETPPGWERGGAVPPAAPPAPPRDPAAAAAPLPVSAAGIRVPILGQLLRSPSPGRAPRLLFTPLSSGLPPGRSCAHPNNPPLKRCVPPGAEPPPQHLPPPRGGPLSRAGSLCPGVVCVGDVPSSIIAVLLSWEAGGFASPWIEEFAFQGLRFLPPGGWDLAPKGWDFVI